MEFLAGLTGISQGELSKALKTETEELKSPEEIQSFLSDHFKKKLSSAKNEGHGRGTRESLTKLEKQLAEEWEIEHKEGMTIQEMAGAWASKSQKPGSSSKLTPESVKAHDVYVNDMKAEIAKRTALEDQFNQFKTGVEQKELHSFVSGQALPILEKHKFALPEKQNIKETQFNSFMSDLTSGAQFKKNEKGEPIVLDKEGNPLRNDLMNEISYEDYVISKASNWFDKRKDDGRTSPGAQSQQPGGAGAGKFPVVKSANEFFETMGKIEKLEDKQAFKQQYEKQLQSDAWN